MSKKILKILKNIVNVKNSKKQIHFDGLLISFILVVFIHMFYKCKRYIFILKEAKRIDFEKRFHFHDVIIKTGDGISFSMEERNI